jgi:hypothetical protein
METVSHHVVYWCKVCCFCLCVARLGHQLPRRLRMHVNLVLMLCCGSLCLPVCMRCCDLTLAFLCFPTCVFQYLLERAQRGKHIIGLLELPTHSARARTIMITTCCIIRSFAVVSYSLPLQPSFIFAQLSFIFAQLPFTYQDSPSAETSPCECALRAP